MRLVQWRGFKHSPTRDGLAWRTPYHEPPASEAEVLALPAHHLQVKSVELNR